MPKRNLKIKRNLKSILYCSRRQFFFLDNLPDQREPQFLSNTSTI